MPSWLKPHGAPLIVAHRGASAAAPENTVAAFRLAQRAGADAVELDARLTRDGVPVVFHDRRLERITGAHGRLADWTAAELASLSAGRFSSERIPLLADVVRRFSRSILLNIELKPDPSAWRRRALVAAVCRIVAADAAPGSVLLSSFSVRAVREAKLLLPSVPAAILYHPVLHLSRHPVSIVRAAGADAVFFNRTGARKRLIAAVHASGLLAGEYTVNTRRRLVRALRYGADVLFTDEPAALIRMLRMLRMSRMLRPLR